MSPSCPLDWFDPEYFHSMDIEFWALYIDAPIALPLVEHCGLLTEMGASPPDWKNMPEAEFMEKYGNAVQAQYNLPTEEELTALNRVKADLEGLIYENDYVNRDMQLLDQPEMLLPTEMPPSSAELDMQLFDQPEMPPPTELDQMMD